VNGLLLAMLLTTAFWYLGTRALITQPLWSRYPVKLARFMDCAACSGFWWGVVVYLFLTQVVQESVLGLNTAVYAPVIGFSSLIWTPLVAALHQRALDGLGSAVIEQDDAASHE
jgi:hypothetical protein